MITNSKVTIYHKGFNTQTKLETWTRYNYDKAWFFGGRGAGLNKGYADANDVDVRIPYNENKELDINNFALGDMIVQGELNNDIETQEDLKGNIVYYIKSINNNNFGINQHIHLGGK